MDLLSLDEINMFSKAVEIQSLVDKPKELEFNVFRTAWDKYGRIWFKKSETHLVWIPYQEDLQIIANHQSPREFERIDFTGGDHLKFSDMRFLLNRFNNFMDKLLLNEAIRISPRLSQFNSIRLFWLAFAMQEQYNKSWNGYDWVRVGERIRQLVAK